MTATVVPPPQPPSPDDPVSHDPSDTRRPAKASVLDRSILGPAARDSVVKLNPRVMAKNPVMFVVEVGAVLSTVLMFVGLGGSSASENTFNVIVTVVLWFTVLFANFAEAMAEGRGKAQAASLRATRQETSARRRNADGSISDVASTELDIGDEVVVVAGEVIPGDGDIVEGIATVDESAITGESAPVVRESGGDRSAVTGGTRVLSDEIVVRISTRPGESFLDRMIALVEGAERQKTPNEVALGILLSGLTIIFLLAVVTLQPFATYSGDRQSLIVLTALLVCLIPTTIGGLLSSIGIAGMDRLVQRNVLAMSGRAVEAAGDVSTLLLDKTGTITFGNRRASRFVPVHGVDEVELAEAALVTSLADETPEGRSIVDLAAEQFSLSAELEAGAELVPFTAQTRMSGVDLVDGRQLRKGAADSVRRWVEELGGSNPPELISHVADISNSGGTPLVVADGARVLGVVHLKDVVKPGMRERFDELRALGIRTVMITGDNPLTAKAIAAEAGVDDYLAEATPEQKMELIRAEQAGGRLVAMTGDGTNDAPALAAADVGVAMNTGTQAAKEAGNMVDLDSNPTKLIEIVEIGKQLLITRGSLTTFSIANDVAKYFAIIPGDVPGRLPRTRCPQHHGPGLGPLGDPVGGHLQRPDHRGAHPAGTAGSAVPGGRRRRGAAAQHRHLRAGRADRPVHRHQSDRPDHHHPGSLLMRRQLLTGLIMLGMMTALLGIVYPLAVTGVAQLAFGNQANGSILDSDGGESDGVPVASALIGQPADGPEWFHPRPSAAGDGYDGAASGASNLGPTSDELLDLVGERVDAYRAENGLDDRAQVPVDAVTASGSGLDPHISLANAQLQAPRVAAERGLDDEVVADLIDDATQRRPLGVLGDDGVNVVQLNLALENGEAR